MFVEFMSEMIKYYNTDEFAALRLKVSLLNVTTRDCEVSK